MRIITLNVNGIRSATKKGLFNWLTSQDPDVVCFQEVRAPVHWGKNEFEPYGLPGYHAYYQSGQKSGYSGVGILTRHKPTKVVEKLGFPLSDEEGRYVHIELGDFVISSIYFPSGGSGEARQTLKYHFMARYQTILDDILASGRPTIICGDWNIAHKEIDLKNWRANQKYSGFLPEERAWLDLLFEQKGFVDAFRVVNQEGEQYTWWSNFGRAWEKNVGWRIDYHVVTPSLRSHIKRAEIYKAARFSDHAPLTIEYDW